MPERYVGKHLGRFRIDALIGSGGFAWVYRGYDPELDIPVAAKVLKPQFAGDPSFESRFRREASIAARLRHPNIVRILAVGREEQAVYFVMDYLPHGLTQRLETAGTLPEPALVRLGMDVAAALAFAHREGVVHRDVKTDNILFDPHGNAIVADFGIARAVSGYTNETGTNMVVGTPQYFAPEQARGQALDGRADIYALGVTLFRAATGVLPFEGDDWYEVARRQIEELPPAPRSINATLSPRIEQVLLTCLEKDPARRYQSADALRDELSQLHAEETVSSERTLRMPVVESPAAADIPAAHAPSRARQRALVATLLLGALAIIAAISYSLISSRGATALNDTLPPASIGAAIPLVPDSAPDSARASTADTLPPAPPVLAISAPATARIYVDGRSVGHGAWRSAALAPGAHVVEAVADTNAGCETGRMRRSVNLPPGDTILQDMPVHACGTVLFRMADITRDTTTYLLHPLDDGSDVRGALPQDSVVMVPAGTYDVSIVRQSRYCAPYRATWPVAAGDTTPIRVALICAQSH
ncbi:MAG TPA: serine/threonine-protein kinase [Gemmatimonadaceae bacterium]|nr:serine/threonine-protein kinase [Gemmatimonadaceae bacterium]